MMDNLELKGAHVVAQNVTSAGDRPLALQINLVHHLPGRLRFRSAALKGKPDAIEQAKFHLGRIAGVTSVTANPCTGSVLLEYDPAILPPEHVIDVLAAQGCVAAAQEQGAERDGAGWADRLVSAVGSWIVDALAERLALAVIGALA